MSRDRTAPPADYPGARWVDFGAPLPRPDELTIELVLWDPDAITDNGVTVSMAPYRCPELDELVGWIDQGGTVLYPGEAWPSTAWALFDRPT